MIDIRLYGDVLASEWTKLRSIRSTYWCILAAIVLGVGLGALIAAANAHAYAQMSVQDKLTFDPTSISTAGLFFSQLALGVMAILAMSSEYSSGTIRTTLCAVPQRGYVLAAKSLLVAVIAMVTTLVIAFSAFFIGQQIFKGHNLNVSLSDPGVLRAVLGTALYMGGLVLFALGLATIIRHTAGAITTLVGVVFVLPAVSNAFPKTWQHDLARYFPANAGSAVINVVQTPTSSLGPWTGYAVFLIWVIAILGSGWYLLRARDVQ
jgi:ABC-2 type transport system permease protein